MCPRLPSHWWFSNGSEAREPHFQWPLLQAPPKKHDFLCFQVMKKDWAIQNLACTVIETLRMCLRFKQAYRAGSGDLKGRHRGRPRGLLKQGIWHRIQCHDQPNGVRAFLNRHWMHTRAWWCLRLRWYTPLISGISGHSDSLLPNQFLSSELDSMYNTRWHCFLVADFPSWNAMGVQLCLPFGQRRLSAVALKFFWFVKWEIKNY